MKEHHHLFALTIRRTPNELDALGVRYDATHIRSEYTLYHGHSYSGNALAAAVALRHLQLLDEWQVLANVAARAEQLGTRLAEWIEPLGPVRDVRRLG